MLFSSKWNLSGLTHCSYAFFTERGRAATLFDASVVVCASLDAPRLALRARRVNWFHSRNERRKAKCKVQRGVS